MNSSEATSLPSSCGVYLFKDKKGRVIYVGKAANLKRRVKSYFRGKRDVKTERLTSEADSISFEETDTVIEALIREAELIKKHKPDYNIKGKDDSSFLYVVITDEEYPRVILKRGAQSKGKCFGPFVSSSSIRQALRTVRKIFPFSTHTKKEINKGRECLHFQIGLCPGVCTGKVKRSSYLKEIKNIELFFRGKKKRVIETIKKEMEKESKALRFEEAQRLKRKLNSLLHIHDTALISDKEYEDKVRIEGYDVSCISGSFAVGSMVVFEGGSPKKSEYRKFKIRDVLSRGDTQMIEEVIKRRLDNDWKLPEFILVDGGEGQVRAVRRALFEKGFSLPVVGIAKGADRKGERIVGRVPKTVSKELLLEVRDEAHRFALRYHRETMLKRNR